MCYGVDENVIIITIKDWFLKTQSNILFFKMVVKRV
jgi:hypothetical protein